MNSNLYVLVDTNTHVDEEMENVKGNIFRLEEFEGEADAAKAGKETGSSHASSAPLSATARYHY